MAKINVDIDALRESGNNVIRLSKDYNNVIEEMMKKLENISENHVWNGNSAVAFVEKVKREKKDFVELGKSLNSFGNSIVRFSDDLSGVK